MGPLETGGQPRAHWAWCKYGCDFIREDGQWKIWHLHVFGIFLAPYDRSWVEQPEDMVDAPPMLDEHKPDRPPTTHWQYMPDRVYVNEQARRELGWQPQYDFRRVCESLEAGHDPWSPLARLVGSKGYHFSSSR